MSTILPTPFPNEVKSSSRGAIWPNWLREPLLHFLLLGGLLFGLDHVIVGRADDPRTIYVDAAVDSEARSVFKKARGREPNEDELYALRRVWLDNEVLYREGLTLGVDKGDQAIRERVIFKMLSIVNSNLKAPPLDDQVLQGLVREEPRQVRRTGTLRLPRSRALGRQIRSRRARVRGDAAQGDREVN